jgi:hypothetical protein
MEVFTGSKLEPEVHIIEVYFREVQNCLTITNVRCENGREIDLLAINPKTGEKYHVESRIATTRSLYLTLKGHRRGLDYFDKEKFNHLAVVNKIKEIFGDTNYQKVLVIWCYVDDYVEYCAEKDYGIKIMFIKTIIEELKEAVKRRGSRDDIMRLIELITEIEEIGTTSKA